MAKLYLIKNDFIVNAERYLDKLKYRYNIEFEFHDIDELAEQIYILENALINAKSNASGYTCKAEWGDYEIIKNANDERVLLDLALPKRY